VIASDAGRVLQEQLRTLFIDLRELDKTNSAECDELVAATVATLRNWKPLELLAAVGPAVGGGQ
jgi:hypothetical protein